MQERLVHLTNYCMQVQGDNVGAHEEGNAISFDDLDASSPGTSFRAAGGSAGGDQPVPVACPVSPAPVSPSAPCHWHPAPVSPPFCTLPLAPCHWHFATGTLPLAPCHWHLDGRARVSHPITSARLAQTHTADVSTARLALGMRRIPSTPPPPPPPLPATQSCLACLPSWSTPCSHPGGSCSRGSRSTAAGAACARF